MLVGFCSAINNNYYNNTLNKRCAQYPNFALLKQDTVSFSGRIPKDLMDLPQEKIIAIAKKAIKDGDIIGQGKEAVTYKIEEYPMYCVRREKRYTEPKEGLKVSKKLSKYDLENHVVARLDEGTTIMHYIAGVPIKITNGFDISKNELKRTIQGMLANEFTILPFKKVLNQIEFAKSKGIDFDRFGENLLVDPMNHEMVCIDFSPKILDTSNEYNPISYLYSALDVDNTQHATRVFGKLCSAYAERLLETPVKNLNLDKLDMHFYHRGFDGDSFNYFPDREVLHETERKLQDLIKAKQDKSITKEYLEYLVDEFKTFIHEEVMPLNKDSNFFMGREWY